MDNIINPNNYCENGIIHEIYLSMRYIIRYDLTLERNDDRTPNKSILDLISIMGLKSHQYWIDPI